MNILEMTDKELYETGLAELKAQLGSVYTERFLQQFKPRSYDYTAERHKLLANQPDIDIIVDRIRKKETAREAEERVKAERVAAWRKGSLELTDLEICELGAKILADKLHVYGSIGFFKHHFKHLNDPQPVDQPPVPDNNPNVIPPKRIPAAETQD